MKCENCGEHEASIPVTRVDNGEAQTVNLCDKCAPLKGIASGTAPHPAAGLLALLSSLGEPQPSEDEACAHCGTGAGDFRESGQLGCPECYECFAKQLRPLLKRLHGSDRHEGKKYVGARTSGDPRQVRLDFLARRLERAVEVEDFESAADLRDQISALREAQAQ